jgi:iron complex outermembrane receptor protein
MANALSDDSITWKVGVEYDAGSRSMLYATAATGFKAGGFDLTQVRKYDAEKLLSFELGSKNRFFGNTLQLNVSAFYWIYKDHQDQYLRMVDGAPSVFTYNAERVRIYGVDVEIEYQPTAADNVHFAVEYLNSQYTDFAFETGGPFNPVSTTCSLSGPNGPLITLDCAGRPLARAPKWSGTAGYSHSFFLSDGGAIKLGGDLRFASERFLNQNFMPGAGEDEGYLVANAEAGYTFPGDKVVIAGFVRNLTNEVVYTGGLTTAIPGEFVAQVAAPRTYGVRAAVAF